MNVLIVEDNPISAKVLEHTLDRHGYESYTAKDGDQALEYLDGHPEVELVITDLSMPGADGWSIIEETRRRSPETKVVILTGYGGFAELAVPGGDTSVVDALISKPFNIAEIDLTINRLLVRDESPN